MLKLLNPNILTEGRLVNKKCMALPFRLKLLAANANQVYNQTQKL